MTVKEAYQRVKAMKFFIGQLWISNEPLLRAAYTDLDKAEQEYQEIAFGGVTNVTRASD
ncbi:hypothetical protein KBX49_07670 [Liquorilactobacillus satsumensis]|uniref:hypothetical protein n=1 Tax=Liquorilactobacillus satsumensis TaxID=259059 RepID=UPI0021C3F5EB|nr:hypothetical protein [Liquorilactobacillus satsumensis]MCP9357975.1 hypothetical protein [Liquorilactobacillus satsumensis]MCP9371792.1 hypothetical protein [Liquorilactobacillus satsumensis]